MAKNGFCARLDQLERLAKGRSINVNKVPIIPGFNIENMLHGMLPNSFVGLTIPLIQTVPLIQTPRPNMVVVSGSMSVDGQTASTASQIAYTPGLTTCKDGQATCTVGQTAPMAGHTALAGAMTIVPEQLLLLAVMPNSAH